MTLTDFRHKGSVHRGFQNDSQQKHRSLRIKYLIVFITHDLRLPINFFVKLVGFRLAIIPAGVLHETVFLGSLTRETGHPALRSFAAP